MEYNDAVDALRSAFMEQLSKPCEKMNEAVAGDSTIKSKIYLLLGKSQLREFFKLAVEHRAHDRLRPLFGAPPYFFINVGEAALMRAGGVSARRTEMSGASFVPPHSQISPQFLDQHLRGYSLSDDIIEQWPEPRTGNFFFRVSKTKSPMFRTGEFLEMRPSPLLQKIAPKAGQQEWHARVSQVRHRLQDSTGATGVISLTLE